MTIFCLNDGVISEISRTTSIYCSCSKKAPSNLSSHLRRRVGSCSKSTHPQGEGGCTSFLGNLI